MNLQTSQSPKMLLGLIIMKDAPNQTEKDGMKVLKSDFAFSDLFNFEEAAFNAKYIKNNFQKYYQEKYFDSILVFTANKKDDFKIYATLFSKDEPSKAIFKKEYKGDNLRTLAHKLSSDVIKYLTGEISLSSTRIVFVQKLNNKKEICVVDYDGENFQKLTNKNSISLNPKWFPDNKKIVFTSYFDGNPDLYYLNIETLNITPASIVHGLNITASVSSSGRFILLTLSKDGNPEIYLKDLSQNTLTRITNNSMIDTSPSFAPNEKIFAFVSDRAGYPNIYIMNVDGTDLKRLTFKNFYNDSPVFSPDGSKIAFSVRGKEGVDIWIFNFQTEDEYNLTGGEGYNESPSWSPDGKWLIISHKASLYSKQNLLMTKSDGSKKIIISKIEGFLYDPDWSK